MRIMLKHVEMSLIALTLSMLPHINARAFATPSHAILLQFVPSDANTAQLLHHYAINNEERNDVDVHSRQRRASDAYPNAASYAPVDGFFEGPNRGEYTQPALSDLPIGYYQQRPRRPSVTKKPVDPYTSRFDKDYYGSNSNSFNHHAPVKRQEFVGPQGPPPPSPGNKYVYQPLFKYKATHHKHHKLFVPNLFG